MDIHSHIYLLINDTAHTIALYSTGKCDVVYHVSFISRYMYMLMDIHSHKYLLINDTAHVYMIYHVGICANGYPLTHISTNK